MLVLGSPGPSLSQSPPAPARGLRVTAGVGELCNLKFKLSSSCYTSAPTAQLVWQVGPGAAEGAGLLSAIGWPTAIAEPAASVARSSLSGLTRHPSAGRHVPASRSDSDAPGP